VFYADVAKIERNVLHILQWLYMYIASLCPSVSSIFLDICCKCVYLDIVYVSHICCKVFYLDVAYVLR
jgi:hypothetical protein